MLEHVACRHCQAPNLATETLCFACGQPLRKPARLRERPPSAPWVFWLGMLFALAAVGLLATSASQWIAASRLEAGIPDARMFALIALLAIVGQVGLYRARRDDRHWWVLRRAPELPLSQVHSQDAVWIRGFVQCEAPLDLPYTADQKCVYYHVVVKERDEDNGGWRTTQNETNAVDFLVRQESDTIYLPSGGVHFEAPLFVDTYLADGVKVQVWALAVEVPISVCGRLDADGGPPVLVQLSDAIPVVATWRLPQDYIAELAKRGRRAWWFGWAASLLAGLVLIATVARG